MSNHHDFPELGRFFLDIARVDERLDVASIWNGNSRDTVTTVRRFSGEDQS